MNREVRRRDFFPPFCWHANWAQMNPESRAALPRVAFAGFKSRFREPKVKEGFQDVTEIEFKFRGTQEEYAIWGRYWI